MMLHSIVPPEMIFPPAPNNAKYYRLKYGFAELRESEGKMLINRINSTNPQDYLSENYSIGKPFS